VSITSIEHERALRIEEKNSTFEVSVPNRPAGQDSVKPGPAY